MKLRSLFQKRWDDWSDLELILAFQKKGKEIYFDALFERYHPLVYNICLNLTANREESKDLTLDVFLVVHTFCKTKQVEQFSHWLYKLTKNKCLAYIRKQKKEAQKQEKWWNSEKSSQNFMENTAFRRLIDEEQLEEDYIFQKCLLLLSDQQRLCIKAFFLQGLSYKKIALDNNMTEKQVKSCIQNGKRQLKQKAKNYDIEKSQDK